MQRSASVTDSLEARRANGSVILKASLREAVIGVVGRHPTVIGVVGILTGVIGVVGWLRAVIGLVGEPAHALGLVRWSTTVEARLGPRPRVSTVPEDLIDRLLHRLCVLPPGGKDDGSIGDHSEQECTAASPMPH